MKCVILQPSYIPWRGVFHQIHKADLFIFYDDVQYDARGWRNRNRVKTAHGPLWLTIPVHKKGAQTGNIPIKDIQIAWDKAWNAEHWKTLQVHYRRAPFFESYASLLEKWYSRRDVYLADFTIEITIQIARELGIQHTQFGRSSIYPGVGSKTDRLVSLLQAVGADHYITGPAARSYLDEQKFSQAGIHLEYMVYEYPEYPQLYPPFDPQLSILDLLLMTGPDAPRYIYEKP